jgi:hypothetical protein
MSMTDVLMFCVYSAYHNFTYCFSEHETWSFPSRGKTQITVFLNRVLGTIFAPKNEKVTRELRKLHTEELHDLYASPNITEATKSRRMRSAVPIGNEK